MKVIAIIPSRFNSSRFPGKPLAEIHGKTMLQRVYEKAIACRTINKVIIATEDQRIYTHAKSFNAVVELTSSNHTSGTDRCFEAYMKFGEKHDIIINIQGDEPFLNPRQLEELLESFRNPEVIIATLCKKITEPSELFNPNIVKVVRDCFDNALYFSRQPIPFNRNKSESEWISSHTYFKHVGLYAYRAETLSAIIKSKSGSLENIESLEQLRWLENGLKIKCVETNFDNFSIDTPEDLLKANSFGDKS